MSALTDRIAAEHRSFPSGVAPGRLWLCSCDDWEAARDIVALARHVAEVTEAAVRDELDATYREALRVQTRRAEAAAKPSRENTRRAVGSVLFNASNYPEPVMRHILGRDMGALIDKVTDAVAVLPPVRPSREAIIHMLFDQVPEDWDENDIGILADAIEDLLSGRSEAEVREQVEADFKQALATVEHVHQIHSTECVCGFVSDRARSRTEHITQAVVAELAREGGRQS